MMDSMFLATEIVTATFNYDNVPIQLGPFETGTTNWEFLVTDAAHPDCFDTANPGIVDCNVATSDVSPDQYFAIFNNGTVPGILAKKNIKASLFNANGKALVNNLQLNQDSYYEFKNIPDGFYMLIVDHGQQSWPVKLIRTGN
jgi:hypothetical protein